MKESPLFTISWRDALHGLIMATVTPVLFLIQQTIESGNLAFNWRQLGTAAAAGGLAYVLKKFLTPVTPTKEVTQDADGTVTKTVISTDQVKVNVDPKK